MLLCYSINTFLGEFKQTNDGKMQNILCSQDSSGVTCYEYVPPNTQRKIQTQADFIGTDDVIVGDFGSDGIDDVS